MDEQIIQFLTLRFLNDDQEKDFLEDYFRRSLKHVRLAIAFGLFLYALFGILDRNIIPEVATVSRLIRYGIVCPYCVFLILFSFSPHFKRYMQPALVLLIFLGGVGIIVMVLLAEPPGARLYSGGLLLVFMFSYSFLKMRFVHASLASWAVVAVHEIAALWTGRFPFPIFLTQNFFYISANLVGMFTAYHLEFYARRDFLHTLMVKKQEEKKYLSEKEKMDALVERTTTALQESEAKFGMLAEIAPVAIFIHQGGKFIYANPTGAALSGYTREELLNMDFWSVVHPDYRELVRERSFARLRGERPPSHYEIKYKRKDGEDRWAYMNAGVIEFEGKPAAIGTLFDITALKRAEEEKARLHEENIRQYQEKIEDEKRYQREKEKILKDLHDGIGGATMNITLLANLALSESSLPKIRDALATISELGRENLSEIQSFLNSLDTTKTNWHTLTADMRVFGNTMIESRGMSFELEASDLEASAEDVREPIDSLLSLNLFRIYKEALSNIVKHSKAKTVMVTFTVDKGRLSMSVRDDGIGLGAKKEAGRGLQNMKIRAEEMGGTLTITSEHGTCVRLDLPLRRKYAERSIEEK
jgi:PAS domain S-box-containing protein